jgi:hypothetical protein
MAKCRTKLMAIWLGGASLLLLLVFLQIAFGHYGTLDDSGGRRAMQWLLPTVSPSLGLVVGVWAKEARNKPVKPELVGRRIFQFTWIASLAYLGFILLAIVLQPLVPVAPLVLLDESNLVLAPLQGVIGALIGIFFTQKT